MKLFHIMSGTRYELARGGNAEITSVTIDSRSAERGSLFFCIRGLHSDGHSFAAAAARGGAAAIVCEHDIDIPDGAAVIKVKDARAALAVAAANFYGRPADKMTVIGITGTNGKTSAACLMEAILAAHGKKTGVIGTLGFRVGGEKLGVKTVTSTTPDTVELQMLLGQMRGAGADCAVMEVTSHALALKKTDGINYKVGIFTNLTQDHLDFHGTMDGYRATKARFFSQCECAVINADDESAAAMAKMCRGKVLTYGIENGCGIKAEDVRLLEDGCRFSIYTGGAREEFFIPVRGRFSVYNGLGAIGAALYLGVPVADIRAGLAGFGGVPGRIQSVKNRLGFDVVIDYAHTPDGLKNIISAVREATRGRVITVFGCGGDRDRAKRPLMGRVAGGLSDYCVITSDNPRSERPGDIIEEIEKGLAETRCAYEKQPDRARAIERAVTLANAGDSVIIAGKGHEGCQIFADRTIRFDDREEAEAALKRRGAPFLTLKEAAEATRGEIIAPSGGQAAEDAPLRGVCTDTRKIATGDLFIAIKGENFDGHDYIARAFGGGAAACVSERGEAPGGYPGAVIKVASTARALLDLAENHRRKFSLPVVAVTGSSGKTTTKDMAASALSQKYNVLKTEANENNEIGLPQTVLRLTDEHDCAVLELGMNHFGEIGRMSRAARPDICVITNIGMAHAGQLGGRGGVLRAKSEIFDYISPGGWAILNGDDDLLRQAAPPCNVMYFGFSPGCDLRGENLRAGAGGGSELDVYYEGQSFTLGIPIPGGHMAYDALAAAAAAVRLGLGAGEIQAGMAAFAPSKNRMEIFDSPWGVKVMNDSYNANPGSMRAALDVLAASGGRTACILGDMLELGAFAEAEHRALGRYAAEKGIDEMIFVGELSRSAYIEAQTLRPGGAFHFDGRGALAPRLRGLLAPGSTVLIKGSRAAGLDKTADLFREA